MNEAKKLTHTLIYVAWFEAIILLSFSIISSAGSLRTTTLEVRSLPPQNVPSLQLDSTDKSSLSPTNPQTQSSSLQVKSGNVTNVPSLQVKTEHISSIPTIPKPGSMTKLSPLERITAQLHASKMPQNLEIKTEAVSTTGLTETSPVHRTPDDAGLQCPVTQAANSSFVTTQTISKVNIATVTGSGSMTATPTSYTTAVTTTASTTTASSVHQDSSTVLGKRVRRQSSKYEDQEQQPPAPVGHLL